MTEFVHLHNHSEYSLLDGLTTPEEMAELASTNGQIASAITDHGTMGSFIRFQTACKKNNVKPIFGVEAYFVDDVNNDNLDEKRERYHLILLAKNDIGLKNLFRINKVAWTDKFYYKPRIDFETVEEFSEGIICLSGCMGSSLSQAILLEDFERAEYLVKKFKGIFDDDYYLEVQPHNPKELNEGLLHYGEQFNLKTVGTLDCHFPTKKEHGVEEVLLACGQTFNAAANRHATEHFEESCREHDLIKKMDILYPERKLSFRDLDLYMMDAEEALRHFEDANVPKFVLENTMEIAEKCNAEIKLQGMYLPSYTKESKIPLSSNEYLKELVYFALKEMKLDKDQVYIDRVEEELEVICGKNFADYFLILWDIVTYAKENDIAMGTARGSAAGCLIAYCLGITKVDPVKHGLLFFRFLNPERNDFPDIDLDFEDRRRDEIKEYLRQKWGEDRVAGVAAYGTFGVKQAVKTVASTFKIPYNEANDASKVFDSIEEYENTDFCKKYPDILPVVQKMMGRYRNASAHAAGIVVSSVPMQDIVPVEVRKEANTKRPIRVIAYNKDEVGDFGLIKLDPLSLKAVTVIKDCINKIKEDYGVDVYNDSVDIDNPDQCVFDEFSNGNIIGVFQAEGSGYAKLIMDMGINSFDDLVASNALVRPGSFDTQGATYLAVRDGKQPPKYEHDILKNILEESYGTYIYEEQVMKIAVELAGFTWGKADRLRKIISKKKDPIEFKAYESDFIDGATKHISESAAKKLWNDIEKASSYMFNKSHATAYSIMSYQTMWLKVNYPKEFMWATLHNEDKAESITTYVFESIRLGYEIYGPDVNRSDSKFKIDGDGLRFGLEDISGVGSAASGDIIKKAPFDSFEEFNEKVTSKVNVGVIDALEKVGAFESIGHSPYEKERYFGPLLNYPIKIESKFDSIVDDISNVDDGIHIIRGLVKETKRTPKYFRVSIEDSTGTYSGFANRDIAITKKEYVIAMVAGNSILHIEDFNEVDTGSDSKFAKFLNDQADDVEDNPWDILYEKGLNPGLNVGKYSLGYIFNTSKFTTKKGQDMATVYWYIPEYGTLNTMLFGKQIIEFDSLISDDLSWKMVKLVESKKGNGYYINDIQDVNKFCATRGIIL